MPPALALSAPAAAPRDVIPPRLPSPPEASLAGLALVPANCELVEEPTVEPGLLPESKTAPVATAAAPSPAAPAAGRSSALAALLHAKSANANPGCQRYDT